MALADRIKSPGWLTATGLAFVAALVAALYLPFLGNPPVFDDRLFFFGRGDNGGKKWYQFCAKRLMNEIDECAPQFFIVF